MSGSQPPSSEEKDKEFEFFKKSITSQLDMIENRLYLLHLHIDNQTNLIRQIIERLKGSGPIK